MEAKIVVCVQLPIAMPRECGDGEIEKIRVKSGAGGVNSNMVVTLEGNNTSLKSKLLTHHFSLTYPALCEYHVYRDPAVMHRVPEGVEASSGSTVRPSSRRRSALDIRVMDAASADDHAQDLRDIEPYLFRVTKEDVEEDFRNRLGDIFKDTTHVKLSGPLGASKEDRTYSLADLPNDGTQVDLILWATELRRVISEREAYKQQVEHLTDIARLAETNLRHIHEHHVHRLEERDEHLAQLATETLDLKDRELRLLRRLVDGTDAIHTTEHGVTRGALPPRRTRESTLESRPARENTTSTSTTTRSTTELSSEIPDPPIFEGRDGSLDFEDWLIRITSKLHVNADHYPTDSARLAYVLLRTGGEAARYVRPYVRSDNPHACQTAEQVLDRLNDIYCDPNDHEIARDELQNLKMADQDDYRKFLIIFMQTAQRARIRAEDYVYEFKKRLPYMLQIHMAACSGDDVTFQQYSRKAAQVHHLLKQAEG